jgi:hypothetical protein
MLVRFRQFLFSSFERLRSLPDRSISSSGAAEAGRTSGEQPNGNRDSTPDELCDDLLCHMLECGCCLNPAACSCPVYNEFQVLIGVKGKATRPALFAV